MKLKDLKNGMSYKNRDNEMLYIINDKVFVKADIITLRYRRELYQELVCYDENFKWMGNKEWDIMEIYDCDNKLIWKRKEIDWSKIPKDTKVLVKNHNDNYWNKEYFNSYSGGKYYTYMNGRTAWSNNSGTLVCWDECKLAEDEKMENIDIEKITNQSEKYCTGRRCSTECDYHRSSICRFAWLLDNYNVSPRKEI